MNENTATEKVSYRSALRRLNLLEAFIAFCQAHPGATKDELVRWAENQPGLMALAVLPESFSQLRKQLKCTGPRGGLRAARGKTFMRVQSWKGGQHA